MPLFSDELMNQADNNADTIHVLKKLGYGLEGVEQLKALILADLDTDQGGIKWWHQYSDVPLHVRILIADQLYQSVAGIPEICLEAIIHHFDLVNAWEREVEQNRFMVQFRNGRPVISISPPKNVAEIFLYERSSMALKGVVQALTTSIDYLAAGCMGILGLNGNLRRADFNAVKGQLSTISLDEKDLRAPIARSILDAGRVEESAGWFSYLRDLRNTLTHRGPRLTMSTLEPRPSQIIHPTSRKNLLITDTQHRMIRAPDHSEVELWSCGNILPLDEPAQDTIENLIKETAVFLDSASRTLAKFWHARRAAPSIAPIPSKLWTYQRPKMENQFPGFNPGHFPSGLGEVTTNPVVLRRMQAALVNDDQITFWNDKK